MREEQRVEKCGQLHLEAILKKSTALIFGAISLLVCAQPTVAGVLLQDDFETASFSKLQIGGGYWGGSNAGSGDAVQISTTLPKTGTHSLQFIFGGGPSGADAWAEKRFELGGRHSEVWVKYDLYIPSNYYHRQDPPSANNKSFVHLWAGEYKGGRGLGAGFEVKPDGAGGSILDFHPYRPDSAHLRDSVRGGKGIEPSDRGTWIEIICQIKAASPANNDGIARVWKTPQGGTKKLIFERTDVPLYNPDGNYFERGYFLGWSNSGFTSTTMLYMDNVVISNSAIGLSGPVVNSVNVR